MNKRIYLVALGCFLSFTAVSEEPGAYLPQAPAQDEVMAQPEEVDTVTQWVERVFCGTVPSDFPGISMRVLRQDHNVLQFGMSCMETPIRIGGQSFQHGLGTHANSEIEVWPPVGAKAFKASVGIDVNDDTRGIHGSARFSVACGDVILAESQLKKGGEEPEQIEAILTGEGTPILLRTDATPDGVSHDQGDWADARFVMEDGMERYLDEHQNPLLLAEDHIPFSFKMGDRDFRDSAGAWQREVVRGENESNRTWKVSWHDPEAQIIVTADVRAYKNFPAVDWVLHFENTGNAPSPVLADIQALDIQARTGHPRKSATLYELEGDACGETTFLPKSTPLATGNAVHRAPTGGRSSSISAFPWFDFEYEGQGIIGAIGWTGQWASHFERAPNGPTRIAAGMEKTALRLEPGETIRTPRIVLMPWRGDRIQAHNRWRRLVLFEYVPKIEGKPVQLPVALQTYDRYNSRPGWATEAGQLEAVEVASKLGCDTYWFDAAWFPGGFPNGVGNWSAKPAEFPNGLKPIGDLCREKGMRFVLWFEPERVAPGSQIAMEHPEFVHGGDKGGLFKLDDPAARAWLTDLLSKRISEYGVTVYRNDFNMDPLEYWRRNDLPDRQGITEIRYVEGLYEMWDTLLKRHPGLWIDNCSSGGRRIDIEMCSRSVPLWRSDINCWAGNSEWNQAQTASLSLYLPLHTACAWAPEDYVVRSAATGGLLCQLDYLQEGFPMDKALSLIQEASRDRFAFYGDFYPLTPAGVGKEEFVACQFHRPDLHQGIVAAFRRNQCRYKGLILEIYGIDPSREYEVEICDDGVVTSREIRSGADLGGNLALIIPKAGSAQVIRYKQCSK